jgi:tripartite-type tricarboxylate transporter receptor subunit TctC
MVSDQFLRKGRRIMKKIKWFTVGFAVMFSPIFSAQPLMAQTYPHQPIQLVITLAPGDSGDLTGRAIGAELSKVLKTPVIPVNKTGGAGSAGGDFVAKAKKDGYTILYTYSSIVYTYVMNPENIPYNPLQDLEPLCLAVSIPLLITVHADSPWNNFQDLINYMQKNPEKVRGSSTGVGSVGHFGYEVIRAETGAAITMVPYKGATPGLTALLGGHVEVGIFALGLISPHFEAKKVRLLLTSKKIPEYPNIPTLTQLGYKRDMSSVWYGFFAPTGVPDPVKKILVSAIEKSIKSADVVNAIQKLGALEDYKTSEEFKKAMLEEYTMGKELLKGGTLSK